ncbi:MAG: alpha/beta hydrolase [Blastopirellula sp.]|nr:alpha/beta hydrolase [Blastopirellula sp.]
MRAKMMKSNTTPQPDRKPKRRIVRFSLRLLAVVGVGFVLVLAMLSYCENYLLYPGALSRGGDWNPRWLDYEDVWFSSADGTRLHGWCLEHDQPQGYLLYCHGNGDHVAHLAEYLEHLRREYRVTVFAFDYRGYGQSDGSPHEQGVLADGHAAQQWLAQHAEIPADQILLMGRSLGGGVAVDLASTNGAKGLILERTFTSLPDVAARLYWWAPVRLLMRNRFSSIDKISSYRGPLLQSHGTADELIPFDIGQQLFAACPSQKKSWIAMPGVGHNSPNTPDYESALRDFITKHGSLTVTP